MSLREYRAKRRFERTPEPKGARRGREGHVYLIHEHAARHLHYDLRLELDGSLKSWALPKGPALDPGEKRLAVHVEDHPIDYASFEGTIPKGEYGAGKVVIWDRGRWLPQGDPALGLRQGKLRFLLEGKRLRGGFDLIRMRGRAGDDGKNWLFIRRKDGRRDDREALAPRRRPAARVTPPSAARQAKLPAKVSLQLATPVTRPPDGDAWVHEIKFDGYRAACLLRNGKASFITRAGKDWTERFGGLAGAAAALPVRQALLDGEVVRMRPDGTTSFQALQNSMTSGAGEDLVYMAFDLLHLDGSDLTGLPLTDRKRALEKLLGRANGSAIRYSDHQAGKGQAMYEQACLRGLEGIVSKRADQPYRPGRGMGWVKVKCLQRQEFVIGGFTRPAGSRRGFGALLLGVHKNGDLVYCGRVGTGFTDRSLKTLRSRLDRLVRSKPPFANPPAGREAAGVSWVSPRLVAEVEFVEWTDDGLLRHPSFQGLREDKDPKEISRERPRSIVAAGGEEPRRPHASAATVEVAGVRLTHPDKVLYAGEKITKAQLAGFYESIAGHVLPHLADRPLMLLRCPEGYDKGCFHQKHAAPSTPRAIRRVSIKEEKGRGSYLVIDSLEGLISLVQMGVLEFHTWGSTASDVDHPDRIVFDLDPGESVVWRQTRAAAKSLRELLAGLGLASFLKTTGGHGLHVCVALEGRNDWREVHEFSRSVAQAMASGSGGTITARMTRTGREGKIFVDYLRNVRGATAVAAYSTRARKGAPVSTPVSWKELGPSLRSDTFTLRNLRDRLARRRADPWKDYEASRATITTDMLRKLSRSHQKE